MKNLIEMLAYMRPAGSQEENDFINRFLKPLKVTFDKYGNVYKMIKQKDGKKSPILWSSHTDTVHDAGGKQKLILNSNNNTIWSEDGDCLGGDCTVGVWLMTEMIKAKIPGLYVFHRAEEVGGLGSKWIAKHNQEILNDIKIAVAFDRRGTTSIITHQSMSRCCSDAFADSLIVALNEANSDLNVYKKDTGGSFTDTANYTRIIQECTNISVGYFSEHTKREYIDCNHIQLLRDALVKIDTSNLVISRNVNDTSWPVSGYSRYYGGYGNGYHTFSGRPYADNPLWDDDTYDDDREVSEEYSNVFTQDQFEMIKFVRENPVLVTRFLTEHEITIFDLQIFMDEKQ